MLVTNTVVDGKRFEFGIITLNLMPRFRPPIGDVVHLPKIFFTQLCNSEIVEQ